MGYVKNVNDMLDGLTHQFIMAEFFQISWDVAKGAYISIMHSIEEGEISWYDRAALMQHRMTHMHAAVFSNSQASSKPAYQKPKTQSGEKKQVCKFFCTGSCQDFGDQHTDPLVRITYTHDSTRRK